MKFHPVFSSAAASITLVLRVTACSPSPGITRMDCDDTLTPVNRLQVKGFKENNSRPGLGACWVGFRSGSPERSAKEPFI